MAICKSKAYQQISNKDFTSCNNRANFSDEISEVYLLISTHET